MCDGDSSSISWKAVIQGRPFNNDFQHQIDDNIMYSPFEYFSRILWDDWLLVSYLQTFVAVKWPLSVRIQYLDPDHSPASFLQTIIMGTTGGLARVMILKELQNLYDTLITQNFWRPTTEINISRFKVIKSWLWIDLPSHGCKPRLWTAGVRASLSRLLRYKLHLGILTITHRITTTKYGAWKEW